LHDAAYTAQSTIRVHVAIYIAPHAHVCTTCSSSHLGVASHQRPRRAEPCRTAQHATQRNGSCVELCSLASGSPWLPRSPSTAGQRDTRNTRWCAIVRSTHWPTTAVRKLSTLLREFCLARARRQCAFKDEWKDARQCASVYEPPSALARNRVLELVQLREFSRQLLFLLYLALLVCVERLALGGALLELLDLA